MKLLERLQKNNRFQIFIFRKDKLFLNKFKGAEQAGDFRNVRGKKEQRRGKSAFFGAGNHFQRMNFQNRENIFRADRRAA